MVVACLALTIALSSAGYAAVVRPANSVGTAQLKKNAVTAKKIKRGNVTRGKIAANAINSTRIAANAVTSTKVLNGTLGTQDIANGSLVFGDFAPNALANAIDSNDVVDFGLSNEDVGVLFAQVNADGTIANSSGGVTGIKLSGLGRYEVDFGRDISACAFVMTQGEPGVGSAAGAITGVTDRVGNVEAVFATTRTDAATLADNAFQLVVVC
jgi:hypothetical protein